MFASAWLANERAEDMPTDAGTQNENPCEKQVRTCTIDPLAYVDTQVPPF